MKVQDLAKLMERRFDAMDERMERLENNFVSLNVVTADLRGDQVLLRLDLRVLAGEVASVRNDMRATLVAVEGLRDTTKMRAEGLDTVRARVDRHKLENDEQIEEIRSVILKR